MNYLQIFKTFIIDCRPSKDRNQACARTSEVSLIFPQLKNIQKYLSFKNFTISNNFGRLLSPDQKYFFAKPDRSEWNNKKAAGIPGSFYLKLKLT